MMLSVVVSIVTPVIRRSGPEEFKIKPGAVDGEAGCAGTSSLETLDQAEVGASQTMIERTEACFGIRPKWLAADSAYGSASNLDWLVNEQGIAPHVPVIDKSQREDGTFSREDFSYDEIRDIYTCPAGKPLTTTGYIHTDHELRYLGSGPECRACPLKAKCCPNMPARRIVRDVNEAARDVARALAKTQAFA